MSALGSKTIRAALERLGNQLHVDHAAEILIVVGAAGVLTDQLPAAWTTSDVDAIHFQLAQDRDAVLFTAETVGRELLLSSSWLSDWAGLYAWTLPDGWQTRRIAVGNYRYLHVYAVSRIDPIRMKFIAHRARDLEHLREMRVRADEIPAAVTNYLDALAERSPPNLYAECAGRIEMAREYLNVWGGVR